MMSKRKEVVRSFNYSDPWVVRRETGKDTKCGYGEKKEKKRELRGLQRPWKGSWVRKEADLAERDLGGCRHMDPYFYAQNFERIRRVGLPIDRKSSETEIKIRKWVFVHCSEALAQKPIDTQ